MGARMVCAPFFVPGRRMANMKIIPIIAAAEHQAEAKAAADIKALIEAIDEEIEAVVAQLEFKFEQITARLEKLEHPDSKPN
jgi:uncharacterized protein YceH (UPF0502 family)